MSARKVEVVNASVKPIIEMEIVDRPMSVKSVWDVAEEVKEIAKTVESGKAVRMRFRSSAELVNIQMAMRHAIGKADLTMHYRKDGADRIVAWAEKVK